MIVHVNFHGNSDESIIHKFGGKVVDKLENIPNLFIVDMPDDNSLNNLKAHSHIKSIDHPQWLSGKGAVSNGYNSWNKGDSVSSASPDYNPFIYDKLFLQAKDYWDRGLTGKGMKVAMIDACGVNNLYVKIKDGVWYDSSFSNYTNATSEHSTAVAGMMAGKPVWGYDGTANRNLSGIAPDADLYVCACGSASMGDATNTTYAIQALNWCIGKKVDVINCSWGGGSYDSSFESALNTAYSGGIAVVVAAGNDGTSSITEQGQFPANLANAIAVAGCDDNKTRWLDPSQTMGAGTGSQTSSTNMFTAPSYSVFTYYGSGNTAQDSFIQFTGTSASSPAIAGLIALHKQALPNKTLPEILSIMQNNCWTFGKTGRNMEYGYGIPLPSSYILNKPITIEKGLKLEYHTTYIEAPSDSKLLNLVDNFSCEVTFSQEEGSGGYGFRMRDYNGGNTVWGLYLDSYCAAFYSYNNAGTPSYGNYVYDYDSTRLQKSPQTWHLVFNYPNIYVYRNGEQVLTYTLSGHMVVAPNNSHLQFGRYIKGAFYCGRVYNRSLSSAEVAQIAQNGLRINNGLILEYVANGNETSTIRDTSGSGLDGTLYGGMTSTVKRIS